MRKLRIIPQGSHKRLQIEDQKFGLFLKKKSQVHTRPGATNSNAFRSEQITSMWTAAQFKKKGQMEERERSTLESPSHKKNQIQSSSQCISQFVSPEQDTLCYTFKCSLNRCPSHMSHDISSFPSCFPPALSRLSSSVWWQPRASSC